jgi:hypothetical protein
LKLRPSFFSIRHDSSQCGASAPIRLVAPGIPTSD